MLVLSRRVGEGVCIGEEIKVSIVRVKGNQVRLMIDAPRSIPVLREELLTLEADTQEETVVEVRRFG